MVSKDDRKTVKNALRLVKPLSAHHCIPNVVDVVSIPFCTSGHFCRNKTEKALSVQAPLSIKLRP